MSFEPLPPASWLPYSPGARVDPSRPIDPLVARVAAERAAHSSRVAIRPREDGSVDPASTVTAEDVLASWLARGLIARNVPAFAPTSAQAAKARRESRDRFAKRKSRR